MFLTDNIRTVIFNYIKEKEDDATEDTASVVDKRITYFVTIGTVENRAASVQDFLGIYVKKVQYRIENEKLFRRNIVVCEEEGDVD